MFSVSFYKTVYLYISFGGSCLMSSVYSFSLNYAKAVLNSAYLQCRFKWVSCLYTCFTASWVHLHFPKDPRDCTCSLDLDLILRKTLKLPQFGQHNRLAKKKTIKLTHIKCFTMPLCLKALFHSIKHVQNNRRWAQGRWTCLGYRHNNHFSFSKVRIWNG
jgi:hypothetical protein